MKKLSFIPLLIFLLVNIQCGGGGDRTYSGTTPVTIKVTEIVDGTESGADQLSGAVKARDLASAVADGEGEGRQLSLCRITVTGPDMADMVREVDIAGKSSIRETLNVPSGLNRSFLIQMFIEHIDKAIVQAESNGLNLEEGVPVDLIMKPEFEDAYEEPPEFSGILSVSNSETRSVLLNWKPATDNITEQMRMQYLIYLTTQSRRDQNPNDIFNAYEQGTGTIRDEDPLMSYTYEGEKLILLSYEYEGAIPEDDNTLTEVTSSGRLKTGVPYLFIVRAIDEWGFEEDNLVESEQIVVYMLDVDVQGSGMVTSEPKGINCGAKCSEDFLSKENIKLTAEADEEAEFKGWSGGGCSGAEDCTLTLSNNEAVTATFSISGICTDEDGEPKDCSNLDDQCNTGVCDDSTGDCRKVPANEGVGCDDGQYCTEGETCQSGACTGGVDPCPDGTTCIESSDTCEDNCTDNDGDTYAVEGGSCGAVDCDDGNGSIHPGSTEVCDGEDNDCNSATADGSGESWIGDDCDGDDLDECKEGQFQCTSGSKTCSDNTGNNKEECDGEDNDCNSDTPDGSDENWIGDDCDGDDSDECKEGQFQCTSGSKTCSDNTGNNKEECDGEDNDCNSDTPDGSDEQWFGDTTNCGEGVCARTGKLTCSGGGQSDTCTPGSPTENPEATCDDGDDNDCDGLTDYDDTGDCFQDACGGCPDDEICIDGQCEPKTQENSCGAREVPCCDGRDDTCTAPGNATCFCDEACLDFDDCCADYLSLCQGN